MAGVAREFDIRENSDHPFTNSNVSGFDFVIPEIYMIREAIKSFTQTLILGTYSFYVEKSGTLRSAKWGGICRCLGGGPMVVGRFC